MKNTADKQSGNGVNGGAKQTASPTKALREKPSKELADGSVKETKEQAILLAAEQEFLAKGYDGARTTSIAEAAGVTHAMLHYYFRTKEQLFERILGEKMELMASSMATALGDPSLPLRERIAQGIANHFDLLMVNPDMPRFIINEVVTHPDRLRMMQANIAKIAGSLFVQLQRDLDTAAERGETERINVVMLMLDILSLNIMPFLIYPVAENVFGDVAADRRAFFESRRAEAVETVMRRIKKQ